MELIHGILRKAYEDHREHFIQRILERYGIIVSEPEYIIYCERFYGRFKKSNDKTIGWVLINDVRVWCMYNNNLDCLVTCYPPIIETDCKELIRACFGVSVRHIAYFIYEKYLQEKELVSFDFSTPKEAALYYFSNTLFPTLHIDFYKYKTVDLFKIMSQLGNIIDGSSSYLQLTIEKKV